MATSTDALNTVGAATVDLANGNIGAASAAHGSSLRPATNQALSTLAPREWPFAGADEVFRAIYTRAGTGFAREAIAVCSAIDGEGKTTVAMGLAIAVAQDFPSRRVLLVETDLLRPVLADDFATEAEPGLVDCLLDDAPLQDACRPTFLDNLHLVPAGQMPAASGRPLRSNQMAAVVDRMRQMYDIVILDVPSILSNSDAALLTDLVDGVVWVVRAGVTALPLVSRALEQIEEVKLRGIVLNGQQSAAPNWLRRIIGI